MRLQRIGCRLPVAVGLPAAGQVRGGQQRLGDCRCARRRRAVVRVGGPQQQPLAIVGAVEPTARVVVIGEVRQRNIQELGGGGQPAGLGGQLIQREQTGGRYR